MVYRLEKYPMIVHGLQTDGEVSVYYDIVTLAIHKANKME